MSSPRNCSVSDLILERGLLPDRDMISRMVLAGKVYLPHKRVDSPAERVSIDCPISIKFPDHPYVSRGGVKLEAALRQFEIDVQGRDALDIGISTGGFTDCLLQHGARSVIGIDVGYGQVDFRLQRDSRLKLLERTNVTTLDWGEFPNKVSVVTIDVSFTSALPVLECLSHNIESWRDKQQGMESHIICLHKPQFEVKKHQVDRGGVVTNEGWRLESLHRNLDGVRRLGWGDGMWIESPITGHQGNVEYLVCWRL